MGGMTEDGSMIFDTPDEIEFYRLATLKYAIRIQQRGIRFKGGRVNPRKTAAIELGMNERASYEDVLAGLEGRLNTMLERRREAQNG